MLPAWMWSCVLLLPLAIRDISTMAMIKGKVPLCPSSTTGNQMKLKKEAAGNLIFGATLLALCLTSAAVRNENARQHLSKIIGIFAIVSALVGLYNVAADRCAQNDDSSPSSSSSNSLTSLDWVRLTADGVVVGAALYMVLYIIRRGRNTSSM